MSADTRPTPATTFTTTSTSTGGVGWSRQWSDLVGAAVLGTDRRPLPQLPSGPLHDLFGGGMHDAGRPDGQPGSDRDDAARLLDRAAALTAARRAGLRPDPAPPALPPCPPDDRPACPRRAARRLAEVLEVWPVLVDEWLAEVVCHGYRLGPEHVVTLLERFRGDPARRALVEQAAGPLAGWLTDRFPDRLGGRRPPGRGPGGERGGAAVPPPAELPTDLRELLDLPAGELAAALVGSLVDGRLVARHRPLLVGLLCRVDRAALEPLATALARVTAPSAALLAADLAVLARTRLDLLAELADR